MKRTRRALFIVTLSTLIGCGPQAASVTPAATETALLRLYTTNSTASLGAALTQKYQEQTPGIQFDTVEANYVTLTSRMDQREEFYFLSDHLAPEHADRAWPVGQDGIAIVVHPQNPVNQLSSDQLRLIYQGFITNWMEVGGSDQEIILFSREAGASVRAEFERLVMGQRRTSLNARVVPSNEAALSQVAQTPGGIAYVSASAIDARARAIPLDGEAPSIAAIASGRYPLRSTLFIIGSREAADAMRAFIAWVQGPEGQAIVSQRHAPLPG